MRYLNIADAGAPGALQRLTKGQTITTAVQRSFGDSPAFRQTIHCRWRVDLLDCAIIADLKHNDLGQLEAIKIAGSPPVYYAAHQYELEASLADSALFRVVAPGSIIGARQMFDAQIDGTARRLMALDAQPIGAALYATYDKGSFGFGVYLQSARLLCLETGQAITRWSCATPHYLELMRQICGFTKGFTGIIDALPLWRVSK